jgi:hypothetical protein
MPDEPEAIAENPVVVFPEDDPAFYPDPPTLRWIAKQLAADADVTATRLRVLARGSDRLQAQAALAVLVRAMRSCLAIAQAVDLGSWPPREKEPEETPSAIPADHGAE